jgi:hypothetical protein
MTSSIIPAAAVSATEAMGLRVQVPRDDGSMERELQLILNKALTSEQKHESEVGRR